MGVGRGGAGAESVEGAMSNDKGELFRHPIILYCRLGFHLHLNLSETNKLGKLQFCYSLN